MKWTLPFVILLMLSGPVGAAEWRMDAAESAVTFAIVIEGTPTEGTFPRFNAEIDFDPARLDQSKAVIVFDLTHIEAFYSDVAENLKKESWFDVKRFPEARFVSQRFRHLGGRKFQVTGDLTIRDVTRRETLDFTLTRYDEQQAEILGRMTISRLTYGVGQAAWRSVSMVAEQVDLTVKISARRK